ILTTHYIEEAEEMADRVGVINHGELILTEKKTELMKKLGSKQIVLDLENSVSEIPSDLSAYDLKLKGDQLIYTYDPNKENDGVCALFEKLNSKGIRFKDLNTKQSSLEEIFVELVKQ
ncbi:MAG: multidrug ABC transporter ATP-binding protein, partial [Bdellovibrionales bacterium]|nr:hypothetical protein [Bdellovibrionales bacterium]NQZ20382.1 multidrug ABC transporter ATP-binding protein [Bdellovibrionales bacterium]